MFLNCSYQTLEYNSDLSYASRNTHKFFFLRTLLFFSDAVLSVILLILSRVIRHGSERIKNSFLKTIRNLFNIASLILPFVLFILLYISLGKSDIKNKKDLRALFIILFCGWTSAVFIVLPFIPLLYLLYIPTFFILLILLPEKYKSSIFYQKWFLLLLFGLYMLFSFFGSFLDVWEFYKNLKVFFLSFFSSS